MLVLCSVMSCTRKEVDGCGPAGHRKVEDITNMVNRALPRRTALRTDGYSSSAEAVSGAGGAMENDAR